MNELDLRDLRYFMEVARQGHMTKAARALHVAQPTLSHALARLEEALQAQLFLRPAEGRPGLRLTSAGQRVKAATERISAELSALMDDLNGSAGRLVGEVTLASMQTLNSTLLPRPLAEFAAAHADVHLELRTFAAETIPRALEEGTIDLGFLAGAPEGVIAELEVRNLLEEELVLIAARCHPLSRRRSLRLGQIRGQRFVSTLPGTFTYGIVAAACRSAGFVPDAQMFLESGEAIVDVVRSGYGVSILPRGYISSHDPSVSVIRLRDPTPRRSVIAAWSRRYPLSAAARAVLEVIARHCSSRREPPLR